MNGIAQDDTAPRLPMPTRASAELPDLAAVRAAGIHDLTLEDARLVAVVLSLFIGKGRSKSRSAVGIAMSLLVAACRVEVVRDGQAQSPALPNLQTEPLPSGATALKRLGIGHVELEAYWRGAKNRADDACLPVAWLLEFVPGGLWPAVRTLVAWGPYEAGTRAEEAVALLAETPIRCGTRRRAAGSPIAAGTLESRVDCLWGLMQALLELRAKVQASANPSLSFVLLEQWTVRPERVDVKACGAKEAHLDNSGPPVQDCADNLLRLYQNYQGALPHRRYLRLRRLLFQALLALIGPREDALRMLDVDDYLPEHVAADGVRGPILRLYPGKTRDHDEAYLLPLPAELAEWLEVWIVYTGRSIGEAESPMWPSAQPKRGEPIKRITAGGLYCAIAGRESADGRGKSRALLPRGHNPWIGYHPHSFRHTAYQAAKRAGVRAKEASPTEFAHVDPEDFARAVCAHSLRQSLKDAYLDLHQVRLARAAITHAWSELWRGGKRYGLDPYAITRHRNESAVLAVASRELEQELARLHERQTELGGRTSSLTGDPLHAALIESNRTASETQVVLHRLNQIGEQRQEAENRLQKALSVEVALPDDLDPEEHARLLAEALGQTAPEGEHAGELANELTVDDLARLYATTPQSINAWIRDGFPRRRPAPWDAAALIVNGPRRKLLPVSAIDQALLTDPQRELLTELRLRRANELAA